MEVRVSTELNAAEKACACFVPRNSLSKGGFHGGGACQQTVCGAQAFLFVGEDQDLEDARQVTGQRQRPMLEDALLTAGLGRAH